MLFGRTSLDDDVGLPKRHGSSAPVTRIWHWKLEVLIPHSPKSCAAVAGGFWGNLVPNGNLWFKHLKNHHSNLPYLKHKCTCTTSDLQASKQQHIHKHKIIKKVHACNIFSRCCCPAAPISKNLRWHGAMCHSTAQQRFSLLRSARVSCSQPGQFWVVAHANLGSDAWSRCRCSLISLHKWMQKSCLGNHCLQAVCPQLVGSIWWYGYDTVVRGATLMDISGLYHLMYALGLSRSRKAKVFTH